MRLLVFAFRGTIAEKVARQLQTPAKVTLLESSTEAIQDFVQKTDFNRYSHALGLGMYSGRDQSELRIETTCSSQFRNDKENLKQLAIPYFFNPADGMKLAKGIGNSWCNLVSYELLRCNPKLKYTFMHVPKNTNVAWAVEILEAQLVPGITTSS